MDMESVRDYTKENRRVKEAIEKENDFLKDEVLEHGADTNDDLETTKTNTEHSFENKWMRRVYKVSLILYDIL